MSFIVGILTFLIVVNCAVLVLLILVQLPKKDAGAGLAFGGGAADALFGAGSGNALTKITKWATGIFFALAIILGHEQTVLDSGNSAGFLQKVQEQQQSPAPMAPVSGSPQPAAQTTPPSAPATNNLLELPLTGGTNTSAAPAH
ncbi:MAG TPA: preprotein translocase subunit SecG [Candidatus Aquilonibacter sp.]|nr:preprotein translocase subunit SecG [Candidatus Aquilonibacter sp.]